MKRNVRFIAIVFFLAACSFSVNAQQINIDWPNRSVSCPSVATRATSVPIVVDRINDVLYSYSIQVTSQAIQPDDFSQLPSASAKVTESAVLSCDDRLAKAVLEYNNVSAQMTTSLLPSKSGAAKYASIQVDDTIRAWHNIAASDDFIALKNNMAELEKCTFKAGNSAWQQLQSEWASLNDLAYKVDNLPHRWSGSATLTVGADNNVSTQVIEMYKGETTQSGDPQPFACQLKSTVLTISAGTLISTLSGRDYVSVPVPGKDAMGNPTTTNVLAVQDSSNLAPLAVGLLNYDIPDAEWLDGALGLALSTGPTFRIGGPNNVSSFGYFGGLSVHLWKRFFVTPGVHIGEFADFPRGFYPGAVIPSGFGTLTPVKRWTVRFGISLSYQTHSIATLGAKNSTPAGGPTPQPAPKPATGKLAPQPPPNTSGGKTTGNSPSAQQPGQGPALISITPPLDFGPTATSIHVTINNNTDNPIKLSWDIEPAPTQVDVSDGQAKCSNITGKTCEFDLKLTRKGAPVETTLILTPIGGVPLRFAIAWK